jgi:hypothetical protein
LASDGRLIVVVPTNGSIVVGLFKIFVTYPFLLRKGIKRPALIWHLENVNHFKRIKALLTLRFEIRLQESLPIRFAHWWLSPLVLFECRRSRRSN